MKPAPPVTRYRGMCDIEKVPQSAVSRILSAFVSRGWRDDHSSSPGIADGIKRPTRKLRTGRPLVRLARLRELRRDIVPLFGLAPCGVLPAICLTADAVRSYRTFSPLPRLRPSGHLMHGGRPARLKRARDRKSGGIFSVPLVLQVTLTGRYPAHCPGSSDFPPAFAFQATQAIIWPTATALFGTSPSGMRESGLRH